MRKLILLLIVIFTLFLLSCSPREVPFPAPEATLSEAVAESASTKPATEAADEIVPTEPGVVPATDCTVSAELPPNVIGTKYYTVTLPEEWKDVCVFEIIDLEDGTYNLTLYELTSHEEMGAGKLCTIMLMPTSDDTYKDFPDYELLTALDTPDGSFYVIALFPTDVQFNENTVETYNVMADQLIDVLWTIRPNEGIEMAMP